MRIIHLSVIDYVFFFNTRKELLSVWGAFRYRFSIGVSETPSKAHPTAEKIRLVNIYMSLSDRNFLKRSWLHFHPRTIVPFKQKRYAHKRQRIWGTAPSCLGGTSELFSPGEGKNLVMHENIPVGSHHSLYNAFPPGHSAWKLQYRALIRTQGCWKKPGENKGQILNPTYRRRRTKTNNNLSH